MTQQLDLAIRGGTLVDGTGAASRPGDLGVRDGKIVAIGEVSGQAVEEIDASGCYVTPGFIDIHTHYDAQVFWDRLLSISPWHGVTSVVMGNCGFGVAPTYPQHRDLILRTLENVEGMSLSALQTGLGPEWPFQTFPEYLDALRAQGTAINVGALVGHTPIRTYVMGEDAVNREATDEEVRAQRKLVLEALEAGAIGFATSKAVTHVGYNGNPVPSRAASHEEIMEIASALAEVNHGVVQATIGPGLTTPQFAELAKATGKPVSWTALLAGFMKQPHEEILEEHSALQAKGIPVYPQVTPRALMFEWQFKAPFPIEPMKVMKPVSSADFEGKKKIYADEEFRSALRERIDTSRMKPRFYNMAISGYEPDTSIQEKTLAEVADERGTHPVDLALDLSLATELEARFRMPVANADEGAVADLLSHPSTMLGLSDAGAHASQLCDAALPSTLLGKWVRERGLLSVEEAVRQLTTEPADVFGIKGRGRLTEGYAADITVFDLDKVDCKGLRRVYDFPGGADRLVEDAEGFRAVIVNGTPIRKDDADVLGVSDKLPGEVLKGGQA